MGVASAQPAKISRARSFLRADERALVVTAGLVFALASAGAAMAASAADAMFLAEIGQGAFGVAVAISNVLLAVVLAVVGGLADRLERRRVLATLSLTSAFVVAGLATLYALAPAAVAWSTYIGGKQLAAATDLAFWVVIAERIDARRSQRLVPLVAATGGAGAAVGALLVMPLVSVIGARGILLVAAAMLVLAGLGASRLPSSRRVAAPAAGPRVVAFVARSWRDGLRAVRRYPLARHLAFVVAAAGVFASLAYTALAFAVATRAVGRARDVSTNEFATLLGGVRGGGQLLTLVVQVTIAPRLLARLGTGRALLLAPIVAVMSGFGLVVAPILAIAIATQVSAKVLDAGVETPAEKLAQTLLPTVVRGRVGGFLDGTAKRAGAVLGGVIAAVLVGTPMAFYVAVAVAGTVWVIAAQRIARELPELAIEHVAGDVANDDIGMVVDDRAVGVLFRELESERPERAAEVLTRLHAHGRVDAIGPLVAAAVRTGSPPVWRSLVGVLDTPAEAHGASLLEAAQAATSRVRALAVRALGLAGGVAPEVIEQWRDNSDADHRTTTIDPAVALAAEVARLRLTGDHAGVLDELASALRNDGPGSRAAIDELAVEIARGLAASADDRVLDAARHLGRALRRGRGDATVRAGAFTALARVVVWSRGKKSGELSLLRSDLLELARERVDQGASKPAPETALVSVVRAVPTSLGASVDDAAEVAAALRLYGALLEGGTFEPDDLRRVARALGEPDDDVRAAAEDVLVALGPAAAGELIATAAWGRRRARDRAAALLADLPVTAATIDRLVDAELDALEQTAAAIAILTEAGDELVARRLDERLREIAHTVLLLVAAQRRSNAIARAAIAWRHARGGLERARTLAVIEAALPRPLVRRLVEAVDDLTPADRARTLADPPTRDAVMRAELAGRDRLSRALVLHALGQAGRSAHRDVIAEAAAAEALAASPAELLRRLTAAVDEPSTIEEGATDMPSRVETLIALGRVPLLAALSTRQLADVAERARWVTAKPGDVVITVGDPIDALIVVDDGELALGERRIVKGDVVDELACVAPAAASADLVVMRTARMIRLERIDFEELVDDVPGLASAVCRALGERARRAEDSAYRSPLATR